MDNQWRMRWNWKMLVGGIRGGVRFWVEVEIFVLLGCGSVLLGYWCLVSCSIRHQSPSGALPHLRRMVSSILPLWNPKNVFFYGIWSSQMTGTKITFFLIVTLYSLVGVSDVPHPEPGTVSGGISKVFLSIYTKLQGVTYQWQLNSIRTMFVLQTAAAGLWYWYACWRPAWRTGHQSASSTHLLPAQSYAWHIGARPL